MDFTTGRRLRRKQKKRREIPEQFKPYAEWVDGRRRMPTFEEYEDLRDGKPQKKPYDMKALKEDLDPPSSVAADLPFSKDLVKDLKEDDVTWLAEVFELEGAERYGFCNAEFHSLNLRFILDGQVQDGKKLADHLQRFATKHGVPIAPLILMLALAHKFVLGGTMPVEVRTDLKERLGKMDKVDEVAKKGVPKRNRVYDAAGVIRDFLSDALGGEFDVGFLMKAMVEERVYERLKEEYSEEFLNQVFEFMCKFERLVEEEVEADRKELEQNVESMNQLSPRLIPKTAREGARSDIVYLAYRGIGFFLKKYGVYGGWEKTEGLFKKWGMSLKDSRVRQWEVGKKKNRSKL